MDSDDEADFREFVTVRWPALVTAAYLITTDQGIAEDCVQEALARVHRRWGKLRRDGNPAGYAYRSVINAALSWRRRRRIREVALTGSIDQPDRETADFGVGGFDSTLLAALRSLPPQMRAAVMLRYLEDRSEAETARLLGCSVGAVKSTTSRGVAKLRAALTTSASTKDDAAIAAGRGHRKEAL